VVGFEIVVRDAAVFVGDADVRGTDLHGLGRTIGVEERVGESAVVGAIGLDGDVLAVLVDVVTEDRPTHVAKRQNLLLCERVVGLQTRQSVPDGSCQGFVRLFPIEAGQDAPGPRGDVGAGAGIGRDSEGLSPPQEGTQLLNSVALQVPDAVGVGVTIGVARGTDADLLAVEPGVTDADRQIAGVHAGSDGELDAAQGDKLRIVVCTRGNAGSDAKGNTHFVITPSSKR